MQFSECRFVHTLKQSWSNSDCIQNDPLWGFATDANVSCWENIIEAVYLHMYFMYKCKVQIRPCYVREFFIAQPFYSRASIGKGVNKKIPTSNSQYRHEIYGSGKWEFGSVKIKRTVLGNTEYCNKGNWKLRPYFCQARRTGVLCVVTARRSCAPL